VGVKIFILAVAGEEVLVDCWLASQALLLVHRFGLLWGLEVRE
jgi:hypothetical protein